MMTEAQFYAHLKHMQVLSSEIARTAMRKSPCRWIDIAIAEGWAKTLEDMFRSAAREILRKTPESPPPLAWFDRFPVNKEDHDYLAQHGVSHLPSEVEDIKAARALLPKPVSVTHRMTGENAA